VALDSVWIRHNEPVTIVTIRTRCGSNLQFLGGSLIPYLEAHRPKDSALASRLFRFCARPFNLRFESVVRCAPDEATSTTMLPVLSDRKRRKPTLVHFQLTRWFPHQSCRPDRHRDRRLRRTTRPQRWTGWWCR